MSSSHALCCLPSVKKQKHDLNIFSFNVYSCNKTIITFGVCDIQNNQDLLIILDITKISSKDLFIIFQNFEICRQFGSPFFLHVVFSELFSLTKKL